MSVNFFPCFLKPLLFQGLQKKFSGSLFDGLRVTKSVWVFRVRIQVDRNVMLDNPLLRYPLKDTWCHDTETDQWLRKANFPGKGEVNLASFTIGNIACVGMSEPFAYDSYLGKSLDHHFYKYDPNADTWTEVSNFGTGFSQAISGATSNEAIAGASQNEDWSVLLSLYVFTP